MTHLVKVKLNTTHPCVVTKVTQTMDLSLLTPSQLKRCANAARRGRMCAVSGYVRDTVDGVAAYLGTAAPVSILPARGWYASHYSETIRVYGLRSDQWKSELHDLINLSNVRWELHLSQATSPVLASARVLRSGWSDEWSAYMFTGWPRDQLQEFMVELDKAILSSPKYRADMIKLADFIATAPKFEVIS